MFELSHSKSKKLIPSKKLRSLTSLQDISRNFHLGSFLKCRFFREETTIQPRARPKAKSLVAPGCEVSKKWTKFTSHFGSRKLSQPSRKGLLLPIIIRLRSQKKCVFLFGGCFYVVFFYGFCSQE